MDKFIEFVSNNYIWFLVITIFLIFALIGYFYDIKNPDINSSKIDLSDNPSDEIPPQGEMSINNEINIASAVNNDNAGVNLQADETNIK